MVSAKKFVFDFYLGSHTRLVHLLFLNNVIVFFMDTIAQQWEEHFSIIRYGC